MGLASSGILTTWRLALGPALFMLAMVSPLTARADDTATHRTVSSEESRVATAISKGDTRSLQRSVGTLGKIIDTAMKRRQGGGEVSACDMAAHSLGFVAVNAADGLGQKGEVRKMLLADAQSAATDFRKDMQNCETLISNKTGNHTSVEKALRAL